MPATPLTASLVLRPATAFDAPALRELAALDSRPVPAGPSLVAEVCGRLRAALSLDDGAAVADPFHRTDPIVAMLRVQAGL